MSEQKEIIDCYVVQNAQAPVLLPVECVAQVLASPEIRPPENKTADWMAGHTTWENHILPVLSFAALQKSGKDKQGRRKANLIVLNPIPGTTRKSYSGLLCYGKVEKIAIEESVQFADLPEGVDKRYADAVRYAEKEYLIPKLTALGVAISYI